MKKLMETNLEKTVGYGQDPYTEDAKEKIRKACNAPEAEVFLLVGGTQTNATVIDALLKSYQGVVAADTGHIATHESGAIEFGGHKVLTVPQKDGKISAQQIEKLVKDFYDDANYEHMVMPGMVYISQPTEYGTLYSREELAALSKVCRENHLPLYVDGARLAYALASPENDVTLTDLAEFSDDCKEMRNPSFLRYNHCFSKQCSAFSSSNVKYIAKFCQISESHIILRACQCIGKAGAIHIKGKMIFPANFAESC